MQSNVIGNIMDKTLDNLRSMVDANTIIGKAIDALDGTVVIPVSKISVGMCSGGGEYGVSSVLKDYPGIGAGGAGMSVTPLGFLVLSHNKQSFVRIDREEKEDKWLNLFALAGRVFAKRKNDK